MYKQVFLIVLILGLQLSLTASAQQSESTSPQAQREKITLRVPNFARGLVEKWVSEYRKAKPSVDFQFVSGKSQTPENSISLTTDGDAIQVARLAVLPVTTKGSQAEQLLGSHALNAKKLKNLFFVKDDFDEERKETKAEKQLHIFTGNSQQSASRLYAAHFHQELADYKGKKIQGDDSFLNTAISRDPLGVTLNSLSNIFDLESRQLRPSLALLPLDIDKQGRHVLSEGRLDDIIQLLEDEAYAEIPIGNVGLAYNHATPVLNDFVRWVLAKGVEYVHQYGLLSLSPKQLAAQQQRVAQKDLAQK